jgi:hypothetical protein
MDDKIAKITIKIIMIIIFIGVTPRDIQYQSPSIFMLIGIAYYIIIDYILKRI